MLEIFLALIAGIVAGIFTGLVPGIHINLVAVSLLASSQFLLSYFEPILLAVFLVSMAITHTFLDTIPAIFLGAPEENTALGILPGHKLLTEGKGYEAVKIMATGSLVAIPLIFFVAPFYIIFLPKIYNFFKLVMPFLLIALCIFLIAKDEKKLSALLVFLLSGVFGIATLNFMLLREPLFPMLSGLFGVSLLFMSFVKNVKIPRQNFECEKINKKEIMKATSASVISGSLVSFLPGLGAAQGAVLGSECAGKLQRKSFLFLLGIIGTLTMALGFVALHAISKPRHGVAVAVGKILQNFTLQDLYLLLATMFFSGIISFFLTLAFAKIFAKKISKINYKFLCFAVIIFITIMTIIVSGPFGLLVLALGTSIGILCSKLETKKMHLMGCLLLPVILYYLF